VSDRKPYKSDLTDERWALIEPVITSWKAQHPSVSGHEGRYEMREIVNALLYQSRTGCQWDYLPHDLPPAGAVKYYFYTWRNDGTDQVIHDQLRWQVREKRGRLGAVRGSDLVVVMVAGRTSNSQDLWMAWSRRWVGSADGLPAGVRGG